MAIAFMRHGQTEWNRLGRVQGHTDIPLNDIGREQAREAALTLAQSDAQWSLITSSPLGRARETAEIVASHIALPLSDPVHELIEQNYGEAEGSSVEELNVKWPTREFERGESPDDVAKRGVAALAMLADLHGDQNVLAVTHGAYIRRLIATLMGLEYYAVPSIHNATLTTFERRDETWHITLINNQPTATVFPPAPPKFQMLTPMGEATGVCTTDGVCN